MKIQMKIQSSDCSSGSLDSDWGLSWEAERSTGLTQWKQVCPLTHCWWTPGTDETVFTVRGKMIIVIWGSVLNPLIFHCLFPLCLWETSSHPVTHLLNARALCLFPSWFFLFHRYLETASKEIDVISCPAPTSSGCRPSLLGSDSAWRSKRKNASFLITLWNINELHDEIRSISVSKWNICFCVSLTFSTACFHNLICLWSLLSFVLHIFLFPRSE